MEPEEVKVRQAETAEHGRQHDERTRMACLELAAHSLPVDDRKPDKIVEGAKTLHAFVMNGGRA